MKYFILFLVLAVGCKAQTSNEDQSIQPENEQTLAYITQAALHEYDVAYFASGCFWCVEAIFESVKGVKESISGYAGGHSKSINYALSNTGKTGHAEAVAIYYRADEISFTELLDVYFGSQNIFQTDGQGPDHGSQYRSIIFYNTEKEKQEIIAKQNKIKQQYGKLPAAEVMPFDAFYVGEDYHQDYKQKHPNHPYILSVSTPRLKQFKASFSHLLKEK